MQRAFTSLLFFIFPLATLGCLIPLAAQAQVVEDGTTSTTVNQDGNNFTINQGDRVGDNLFHSFNEFSVPTLGSAAFNNATDIANIFSRVTGSNISSIDGLISANGAANLFLINPNGIIFGQNASLNLGGSFFASTADSLLFDGNAEFSASNPTAPPLLEVSIPIGANFRDNPGDIVNQSTLSLQVPAAETLALVGGNVSFDGGIILAPGANVELGGLTEAGIVEIDDDSSLTFPDGVARGNVSLANSSLVATTGQGGGSININARNFELTNGSNIFAGIISSDSVDTQAGDIIINTTNDVSLNGVSGIVNSLGAGALGNTGNIEITARNIDLLNGGNVFNFTNGQGDIGNITLNASGDITIDGINSNRSGVQNFFNNPDATGNVGDVNLTAQNLFITNGGQISSLATGIADGGNINLDIANSITVDGFREVILSDGTSLPLASQISSQVTDSGLGNSGDINLNTQNLSITQNGQINASIAGAGNGGDININADTILVDGFGNTIIPPSSIGTVTLSNLSNSDSADLEANAGNVAINTNSLVISNGGNIAAGISTIGNGGSIIINATDFIEVNNGTIEANVLSNNGGNSGNLEINTARLFLTDEALISASVLATGNAGNITINATDFIEASDSSIVANIFLDGVGDGGNLEINTARFLLNDEAFISASVSGTGNAGNITINATDVIEASGNSIISVDIFENGIGNGGDIQINTTNLSLIENASLTSSSQGQGNAGNIVITATDTVFADNGFINSNVGNRDGLPAEGNVGSIQIDAREITFTNTAQVQAGLFSGATGNPGTVSLNARESIDFTGANTGIFSNNEVNSVGDASNAELSAPTITLDDGALVEATNFGQGNGGNVTITAENLTLNRNSSISGSTVSGTGGIVNLQIAEDLILRSGNEISAQADNNANGGNLTINTELIIAFPNGNNDIIASANQGRGGNIDITAESLFGIEERPLNPLTNDINASSQFNVDGNIVINTPEIDPTSGLIELPASVGDASDQISQNPCEQGVGSEFIVTGKGGLPPNVNEALNSEEAQVDLVEPLPQPLSYKERGAIVEANGISTENSTSEAVPAMGWVFNDKGEVTLTAYSTSDREIQRSLQQTSSTCSVSSFENH